jgi:hypothetical protein
MNYYQQLLCRAVYEEYGRYSQVPGLEVSEDDFYKVILGLKPDSSIKGQETYELLVKALDDNKEAIVKLSEMKIGISPSISFKLTKVKHEAIVRLLALYIKENEEIEVKVDKQYYPLSSIIQQTAYSVTSSQEMSKILESDVIKKSAIPRLPKFKIANVTQPVIYKGVFLVPFAVGDKEAADIYKAAISHACTNSLDIPSAAYFKVMEVAGEGQLTKQSSFISLVMYSIKMGITIKELFLKAGLKYISRVTQAKTSGALLYMESTSHVRVYTKNSEKKGDFVSLENQRIEDLHRGGKLGEIGFDRGLAYYITAGQKIPL